jgi:hypothetical protein
MFGKKLIRRVAESGDSAASEFAFPEIPASVLEQIIEYMHYKVSWMKALEFALPTAAVPWPFCSCR